MNTPGQRRALFGVILIISLIAPWVLPDYQFQLALLWMMVIFALTWDIVGGQMGYNSFGNIVFFGFGMYTTAVIQRNLHFSIEEYVHVAGRVESLSAGDYLTGLFLGMGVAAVFAVVVAVILGACILAMGMRGQYFGICTLGLGVAAGELASGWEYIGAGSGLVTPVFPDQLGERGIFFYYILFLVAVFAFLTVWPSMPSVMMKTRPKPWASIPPGTKSRPGVFPPFSFHWPVALPVICLVLSIPLMWPSPVRPSGYG
jgi:branched-chain amino acid transport system permease protein